MFIEYLNIPPVPEELIDPISEIIEQDPLAVNGVAGGLAAFQIRGCKPELNDWCRQNIPLPVTGAMYQIIYPGLPIHIDSYTRTNINYVIFAGGPNVVTTVYDATDYRVELNPLQSVRIEERRWHKIKVDQMHGISGIESINAPRVSIRLQISDLNLDHELIKV